jgi:hypothetical protein
MKNICFACGKTIKGRKYLVDTRDDQIVFVGVSCYKHIKRSGERGWGLREHGPRLYLITEE